MLNESAAPARASHASTDTAPCVYFDGGCPLCSKEIATYRAARGADQLRWVDAQACDEAALGPALDRKVALARLHVRLADGSLLSGAAAFVAIWQRLPAFRLLAWLARVPGALLLMEGAYRAFLKIRPLWRATPSSAWPDGSTWPTQLRRELRTDHAGEAGAVMIYRGILAVTRDPQVREFAQHHLHTEARHLELIEAVVPSSGRSRLLPLWRVAGWLTGALPACFGARAVYATIESVETFVVQHYAEQISLIDVLSEEMSDAPSEGSPAVRDLRSNDRRTEGSGTQGRSESLPLQLSLSALRTLLAHCQQDELTHRDDAHARRLGTVSPRDESSANEHGQLKQRLQSLGLSVSGGLRHAWTALVEWGSASAVRVSRWI